MKRYSQAGTTMVPDCTSLDGKQSGMWVKYEDVEVLLAELNLLRSQVRNSRVPEGRDAQDAARYRYLRAGGWSAKEGETWPPKDYPTPPWVICMDRDKYMPMNRPIKGPELDVAIDKVIGGPSGGNSEVSKHPRTDALIAAADATPETRVVFLIKSLANLAMKLEEKLAAEDAGMKAIAVDSIRWMALCEHVDSMDIANVIMGSQTSRSRREGLERLTERYLPVAALDTHRHD